MTRFSPSPAFQSEARHAKIGILIGQFQIAGIVGEFGNPPRQPEFFAIFDLTAHDEPIRLLEQTSLAGARMTSGGMRYSNIEPDQEIRAVPWVTGVPARPSRNQ